MHFICWKARRGSKKIRELILILAGNPLLGVMLFNYFSNSALIPTQSKKPVMDGSFSPLPTGKRPGWHEEQSMSHRQTDTRSPPFCWSQAPPPGTKGTGERKGCPLQALPPSAPRHTTTSGAEVQEGLPDVAQHSVPPPAHTPLEAELPREANRGAQLAYTISTRKFGGSRQILSSPQADSHPSTRLPELHNMVQEGKKKKTLDLQARLFYPLTSNRNNP